MSKYLLTDEEIHKAVYGYNDVNPHYYIKDEHRAVAKVAHDKVLSMLSDDDMVEEVDMIVDDILASEAALLFTYNITNLKDAEEAPEGFVKANYELRNSAIKRLKPIVRAHLEKEIRHETACALYEEIICPMCYRLNPHHATMDNGEGCHYCQEREDWQALKGGK